MLREEYRRRPVTYFCPQSGIGRGMTALEGHPRRIGILGLGCGTLAAYGRAGDTIRIYEINPQVLEIANRDFTYLKDTAGQSRSRLRRWPPGSRRRIHRARPPLRHPGDGRLLRRFRARPPDHPGSLRHLLPPPEA